MEQIRPVVGHRLVLRVTTSNKDKFAFFSIDLWSTCAMVKQRGSKSHRDARL